MKVPVKKTSTRGAIDISEESAVDREEKIRRRAYELYERRGRENGHETEDWLKAEAELARERTQPLEGEAIKTNRQPPVTSTGKSKVKRVKKPRLPARINTLAE